MVNSQTKNWLRWVSRTPIPLYRLDDDEQPIAIASGCLIRHNGKRLIVSAAHATEHGEWVAEIRFDPAWKETEILRLGQTWTAASLSGHNKVWDKLDFSLTLVPSDFYSLQQQLNSRGEIIDEQHRHEFDSSCLASPKKAEIYAFSGRVQPSRDGDATYISQPTVFPGLIYVSSDNCYHTFRLPVSHPGHSALKGCSGAPIVSKNRCVVGLVCSGEESDKTIRAVSLPEILPRVLEQLEV